MSYNEVIIAKTLITVHLIAFLKVLIERISVAAAIHLNILLQILAHVFIHDRKQKEELFINTFLLNNAHTAVENISRTKLHIIQATHLVYLSV